jgi:hypothetical protein
MPDYDDEDDDEDDSARPKDTPVIMTHLYLVSGRKLPISEAARDV